jgi:hypothetical protein
MPALFQLNQFLKKKRGLEALRPSAFPRARANNKLKFTLQSPLYYTRFAKSPATII